MAQQRLTGWAMSSSGLIGQKHQDYVGRLNRKRYVQELYKHIQLGTLPKDVSLELLVWWAPGQSLSLTADAVLADVAAQTIVGSSADGLVIDLVDAETVPGIIDPGIIDLADTETVPGIIETLPSIVDDPCDQPEEVDEMPKKVRKVKKL
eukprot:5471645-Amphidinium_carterae.1